MTFTPGHGLLQCPSTRGKYDDADGLVVSGSTDKDHRAYLTVFACEFSFKSHMFLVSWTGGVRTDSG